jgi:hypothetical protein
VSERSGRGYAELVTRYAITDKRLAWLAQLKRRRFGRRRHTRVGFDCMAAGWTQWVYRPNARGIPVAVAEELSAAGEKLLVDHRRLSAKIDAA